MEIGNRVIEAYTREFEELPIGYIDRWKVCEETFVFNKYKDGTFGIGNFGFQGKPSFNFGGEWQQRMSLLQVSQPEEYPTPPQTNALRRVRLLVRAGLHMEALCLLNAFLEVNIRDVLIKCIKSDPEAQKSILNMDHKILLDILKKINKGAEDDLFRNKDYLEKIEAAKNILDMRNAYMHRLCMTERTRKRPEEINDYAAQLDLIGKEQILSINQRRELERLMHGFMDVWESHLWMGIQARLASGEDAAAIRIIQQTILRSDSSVG